MKVYDNFLNKRYHGEILDLMGGPSFNWYYGNNITGIPSPDGKSHLRGTDTISDLDEHGFSHPFWVAGWPPQSEHTSFIMPFLYKIMFYHTSCPNTASGVAQLPLYRPWARPTHPLNWPKIRKIMVLMLF